MWTIRRKTTDVYPLLNPLDETTSHYSIRLQTTAAKSLVIPQRAPLSNSLPPAGERTNEKGNLNVVCNHREGCSRQPGKTHRGAPRAFAAPANAPERRSPAAGRPLSCDRCA